MTGRVDIARLFDWCDLHTSRWRTLPVTHGFIARPMYYDRQGFAIGADGATPAVIRWAMLKERDDYGTVAVDELPDGSHLSTTWLGLDQSHGFGAPLIFETMRFAATQAVFHMPGSGREVPFRPPLPFPVPGKADEETEGLRYTTEEEALAAHHEIRRVLVLRLGS